MLETLKNGPEKLMLDQLKSWLKSQGEKQQNRSTPVRWVTWLIVAAIALLAIGFAYWRLSSKGKQLAKLLHERDVAKQEAERQKTLDKVEANEKAAAEEWVRVREAEDRLKAIEAAVRVVEEERVRTHETIDAMRNWDDVDRYLAGGGGGASTPPTE